ncbi:MAG: peptidoglycan-binding domain-containing protein, partial [Candidatus Tectomicrobia bacterium]
MRCVTGVVVLLMLFIWLAADPAWAIDPMLMQAQEKLVKLGYDPGLADGVYGPLTRQALEAFQRAQKLPVTGNLDAAT